MGLTWKGHPGVNPYSDGLGVDRLVLHVEIVVDLELQHRSPLNIEWILVNIAHKGPVGPDTHQLEIWGICSEVDCLPIGHVCDEQVRPPYFVRFHLDHVNATPLGSIPLQTPFMPSGDNVAVHFGFF